VRPNKIYIITITSYLKIGNVREREGERESESQRIRETERQRDRETERERERERGREVLQVLADAPPHL
jgi:hypothetical protein